MVSRQFATGDVTTMSYENDNRQTLRQYSDGTRVTLAYDAVGNTTTMQDSTGTTTYSFDPLNRTVGKTDPGSLVQTYSYDSAGERTKLVDPDGGVRTYAFDLDSRLTTLNLSDGTVVTRIFDAAARLVSLTQTSPAFAAKWTYDVANQVVSVQHVGATLAKTGTAADPSFLWNGGSGYRATTLTTSAYYVRRRHYSTVSGAEVNKKVARIAVAIIGFGLVASLGLLPNSPLKYLVGPLGLVMSLTWDGWYLKGICNVLGFCYAFFAITAVNYYYPPIILATAPVLLALGARQFRDDQIFWARIDITRAQKNAINK